jgi:hypothetical protein
MAPELRTSPPWTDSDYIHAHGPSLSVGYADGFYIIRGAGGEIVGSTQSLDRVGEAIRVHCEMGRHGPNAPFSSQPGCAGIFPETRSAASAQELANITLEELDL